MGPGPRTTVVVVDVEAMEVDEVVAATAVVVAVMAGEDMEVVAEVVGTEVAAAATEVVAEAVVAVDTEVVATEVVAVDMAAEATEVSANLPILACEPVFKHFVNLIGL